MIVATLLASLAWAAPAAAAQPDDTPLVVVGRVELSPAAADASAREMAADQLVQELDLQAKFRIERVSPAWLPGFARDLEIARWRRDLDLLKGFRELGRESVVNDHVDFASYQSRLQVEFDRDWIERSLNRLERRIDRGAERFVFKCGGTAALWGLLGVLYLWLDRLTRGYMGARLRFLLGGVGVTLPVAAFLIV